MLLSIGALIATGFFVMGPSEYDVPTDVCMFCELPNLTRGTCCDYMSTNCKPYNECVSMQQAEIENRIKQHNAAKISMFVLVGIGLLVTCSLFCNSLDNFSCCRKEEPVSNYEPPSCSSSSYTRSYSPPKKKLVVVGFLVEE